MKLNEDLNLQKNQSGITSNVRKKPDLDLSGESSKG